MGRSAIQRELVRKPHVNWGHASSQKLKRTMAEAEGRANGLIPFADDVVRECEACRAFGAAPAIPVARASSASAFNEKVQADLLLLGDITVLHVLDLFSRYSLLSPAGSKNPVEVRDTFCMSRVAILGEPRITQMD